jgi:DNA/RNA-binding protein KIN17
MLPSNPSTTPYHQTRQCQQCKKDDDGLLEITAIDGFQLLLHGACHFGCLETCSTVASCFSHSNQSIGFLTGFVLFCIVLLLSFQVYQELIQDKQHIHMNSTRWASLSDFVKYLGKKGKCIVDETERGWYVQYVEVDAGILARKAAQEQRVAAERAAEVAEAERMEQQRIEAAKALDLAGGTVHREATNLERNESETPVMLSLKSTKATTTTTKNQKKKAPKKDLGFFDEEDDSEDDEEPPTQGPTIPVPHTTTNSKLPAATSTTRKRDPTQSASEQGGGSEQERAASKRSRPTKDIRSTSTIEPFAKKQVATKDNNVESSEEQPWLKRDIIVRIITKKLHDGKYFRRKGIVDRILKENKFSAEVELLESSPNQRDGGDIIRLDQNDLETVVPKEGKKVRILKGEYRGEKAKLVSTDKKRCQATLKLVEDGTVLEKVDFEDFSQLA